jgi:hypothetical protein
VEETSDPLLVLGAVALGGAISLITTYGMARRAESAAAYAAALILRSDLYTARALLESALKNEEWWPEGFSLPTMGWSDEPRGPLALKLTDIEMVDLSHAFEEMTITNQQHAARIDLFRLDKTLRTTSGRIIAEAGHKLAVASLPIDGDEERKRLEMTHAAVMRALEVLLRHRRGWLAQSLQAAPRLLGLVSTDLWLRARLLWTRIRNSRPRS